MIPPLRPGAKLLHVAGPVIEIDRLILRSWRVSDVAPNTAMLSDPETARFIDGEAELGGDKVDVRVTTRAGWRR